MWWRHLFSFGFLVNDHLPRGSPHSHPSDERGDREAGSGAVRRSPGIYQMTERNPIKSQLGTCIKLWKRESPQMGGGSFP